MIPENMVIIYDLQIFDYLSLFTYNYSLKKGGRTDDLVKTPVSHDVGALRRCNPPAFLEAPLYRVITWPAIDKRSHPVVLFFNVEYPDQSGTTRIVVFLFVCKGTKKNRNGKG
jgi:hypothetical protein